MIKVIPAAITEKIQNLGGSTQKELISYLYNIHWWCDGMGW